MDANQDKTIDAALDAMAVAPAVPHVREAHDAGHDKALARDPAHEEGKLDVGLDESFPSSDPAAATQPGNGEPAPSSGYDEEAEKALQRG